MAGWKEFDAWFNAQYVESRLSTLVEGDSGFQKFLKNLVVVPAAATGIMRMRRYVYLRYRYPLSPDGYICAKFSIVVPGQEKSYRAIYAMAFWRSSFDEHENISEPPEYVLISSTFDSQDGEYRRHFMRYDDFRTICENNIKVLSDIEQHLLAGIASGKIGIDVHIYPEDGAAFVGNFLSTSRLSILLSVAALVQGARYVYLKSQQVHANSNYIAILFKIVADLPDLIDLSNQLPDPFLGRARAYYEVECGAKFTPLTIREIMQPNDINFGAWRELYARQIASDMVLNAVAPSFALDNQWMVIEKSGRNLFENKAMHTRFTNSEVASLALAHVRDARLDIKDYKENTTFNNLDSRLYSSVEYAQSFLVLSDAVLCATTEHAGNTVASYPMIYARTNSNDAVRPILHESVDAFSKIAFDIFYGCHCLHTKTHLVHGDLHGNNMTQCFYSIGYRRDPTLNKHVQFKEAPNPTVAYIAGTRGVFDTYVFPFSGAVGVIIDFSRSIFGPGRTPTLEKEFGAAFTTDFYHDQLPRTLKVLARYASSFVVKNQEKLKAALLAHPEQSFRALSYVDFMAASSAFVHMLTTYKPEPTDKHKWAPAAEVITRAKHFENVARDHLITYLFDLVEQTKGAVKSNIPFAGEILIPKLFKDYTYNAIKARKTGGAANIAVKTAPTDSVDTKTPPKKPMPADPREYFTLKDATLCDVFNINNPIKWSGREAKTFPPWADLSTLEANSAGLKLVDIVRRDAAPFLAAQKPAVRVDLLAERARAEQAGLDAPASPTSSWLVL